MPKLCVNVDHIATVRQARLEEDPSPLEAARLCEKAGAIGITAHLREDRRHIQDRDVFALRKSVRGKLNLEMAATAEMVAIARKLRPDEATLVPEKRKELTTEGGLEVAAAKARIARAVAELKGRGIAVSLFIAPDAGQVRASAAVKADFVEFHTGEYAHASKKGAAAAKRELRRLAEACALASELGLKVNLGHGLTHANVGPVCALPQVHDLNIGHSIVARACLVGLERSVKEMIHAMNQRA
jgi:pyridoxine 5-phosphate synthase